MKKLFFISAVAIVALASAVSCQKETSVSEDSVQVTLTVEAPVELGTKATTIADGLKATELLFAVYNTDKTQHIESLDDAVVTKVGEKSWEVKMTLVKSYTYHIFFWAQTANSTYYSFDKDNGTITVDYSGAANDDNRDAFCKLFTFTVPTTGSEFAPADPVVLTRPFAQINLCASDYEHITELELELEMTSKITVSGVSTKYNFLTGTVSEATAVDFTLAQIPAELGETIEVNKTDYAYVGMNYILAPENTYDAEGKVVINRSEVNDMVVTFAYNGSNVAIDVPNVPYQRNFRTNLVGNFFTGEASIDVIIDNSFLTPDEIVNY